MKKTITLLLVLILNKACFSQIIKSYSHPMGYGLSATSARLIPGGYLVASKFDDGTQPTNYITCYRNDGSIAWTRTEQSGQLAGIMDMTTNSHNELYFLAEDLYGDDHYGLMKTDSMGNVIWTRDLGKNGMSSYDAPRIKVNTSDEVYVMSSTTEKTHLYKLSDAGNLLWSTTIEIDTVMTKNPAFGMEITSDGGVICSGKSGNDIFLGRFATDGTLLWTKRLFDNDLSYSHPKTITRLQDGNYLIAGFRGENVAPYTSGMFLLKTDENGTVLNFKFYTDTLAQYAFIPYAIHEFNNGNIQVMGCGGMVTFADFDAALNLEKYSVWTSVGNFMVSAGDFDYRNNQLLVTGTDDNTTQYIMRNAQGQEDFCNQEEVYTITQKNIAFDNSLYNTTAILTKGPGCTNVTYTLQVGGGFNTTNVCGALELTLGQTETVNQNKVNVYPNPVSSNQNLNLNLSWDDETTITLVNAGGQTVLQQTTQAFHTQVSINNLPKGLYFLNMAVNGKTRYSNKVVVF